MTNLDTDPEPANQVLDGSTERRNSSSSYSSDAYATSNSGHFTLILHGNCSRCHHRHSSARFRVNLSRDPSVATDLRCQRCHEKWLVIGGRNSTQLSLISVNTIRPDPVMATVRYSLVDMVRSTTAIATLSPAVAAVAGPLSSGSAHQESLGILPNNSTKLNGSSTYPPLESALSSNLERQEAMSFHLSSTMPPPTTQKHGLMTRRRVLDFKKSLSTCLNRANLKSRIESIGQSKLSARPVSKRPATTPVSCEVSMNTGLGPADNFVREQTSGDIILKQAPHEDTDILEGMATSDSAKAQVLSVLENDTTDLYALNEEERVTWVRAKYTSFKERYDGEKSMAAATPATSSHTTTVMLPQQQVADAYLHQVCHHSELAALGSHFGAFDDAWPNNPSPRTSNFNISEDRTSEAETALDDAAKIRAPRYSQVDFLQRERRNSGSPHRHSISVQKLRQSRHRRGYSADSAVTHKAVRTSSKTGSLATTWNSHDSAPRSSFQLNFSETSLTRD